MGDLFETYKDKVHRLLHVNARWWEGLHKPNWHPMFPIKKERQRE